MIIGTSEDGIVRQCEQCNAVYKGNHCPHCALAAMNRNKRPKKAKKKKTYAQKQIKSTLKLSEEQEKFLKEQEKYNNK